jgi:hypothetical protein
LQSGHVDEAIDTFKRIEQKHHTLATFNLALLYSQGHGDRFHYPDCFELFKKAGHQGHENSIKFMSKFVRYGSGFGPGASASSLIKEFGSGFCPALISVVLASDILCNLDGNFGPHFYVTYEAIDISSKFHDPAFTQNRYNGEYDYLRLMGMQLDGDDALDRAKKSVFYSDSSTIQAYTPRERSWSANSLLKECILDHGMSSELASFIWCTTIGLVAKQKGIVEKSIELPSVSFFLGGTVV